MTKNNIYFTIEPTNSGFTDQMMQFAVFYKLGLVSGYTYLHRPFFSSRSLNCDSYELRGLNWRRFGSFIKRHFGVALKKRMAPSALESKSNMDVYEFLGFNEYFHAKHKLQHRGKFKEITVKLSDDTLRKFDIDTVEDLQRWLGRRIQKTASAKSKVLLKLTLSGHRKKCFELIHSKIPDYPDGLDLRTIYFEKRRKCPWNSAFTSAKVKTLVHMRQGDTATLETPWNTFISLWPKKYAFKEYSLFSDIPTGRLMQVEDYYHFLVTLSSYFSEDTFSMLLFSDGFSRSFRKLKNNIHKLNSPSTKRLIGMDPKIYDETKFAMFRNIKNSTLFLGEDYKKLRHLIHSVLTADLVITSKQQRMVLKLLANYCDAENMPIVIVLNRFNETNPWDNYKSLGLYQRKDKFIMVNMSNPDYTQIAQKLVNLLALS